MKQFFVSFRYFSFFILLLFPISYTQACYIPSTLKDKEVTSAECTSFGGSSGCVSGQVKIGTISGFLGGAGCGVDYNTYVNLINEGKLPQDESLPKPSSEITCTSQNGRCGPCNASESESGFCNTTEGSSVACCFPSLATPTSSATPSSFNYTPLETIPGTEGMDTSTLKGFLEGLFLFIMWSAGVASMFMIVIGGFWYMTSAGNTARVGEAKKIITNALLGLIVVLIAWLLLYVINPDLVKVDLSSLEVLTITENYESDGYSSPPWDGNPIDGGGVVESGDCSGYSMPNTQCALLSGAMQQFLTCVRSRTDAPITITSLTSNTSGSDLAKSQACCGNGGTRACPHGSNSCHHGCKTTNKGYSYAVDFSMTAGNPHYCTIAKAALACGAKERFGPRTTDSSCGSITNIAGHSTHFHFSVGCP